jgi:hypothetical protein
MDSIRRAAKEKKQQVVNDDIYDLFFLLPDSK